jgi:hypothetical protein
VEDKIMKEYTGEGEKSDNEDEGEAEQAKSEEKEEEEALLEAEASGVKVNKKAKEGMPNKEEVSNNQKFPPLSPSFSLFLFLPSPSFSLFPSFSLVLLVLFFPPPFSPFYNTRSYFIF